MGLVLFMPRAIFTFSGEEAEGERFVANMSSSAVRYFSENIFLFFLQVSIYF